VTVSFIGEGNRQMTDDGQWTPSDGKSSHCLWQGELKIKQQSNLL
jgi:hypothetical protein